MLLCCRLAGKFRKAKRNIVVNDTDDDDDDANRNHWNGYCPRCEKANNKMAWCNPCDRKTLVDKFTSWSTGNKDLDLFIQETQRTAKSYYEYLEYVPYDRFTDVRPLARGGFAKVFTATWLDGKRNKEWGEDNEDNNWIKGRTEPCTIVLKLIDNSSRMEPSFISGLKLHYRSYQKSGLFCSCYGITRDLETMNYALILEYFSDGDLRENLTNPGKRMTWMDKLCQLRWICDNLKKFHENGYVHRDLHGGNILLDCEYNFNYLTDFGLTRPANSSRSAAKTGTYGVVPYMAPELFRGEPHSKASDIYAIGIIMSELASDELAFSDRDHDVHLQLEIIDGLRPKVPSKTTPKCYKNLMDRCLSGNPRDRPVVEELCYLFYKWDDFYNDDDDENDENDDDENDNNADELKEFKMADERWKPKQQKARHPGAIYMSRLIPRVSTGTIGTSTCWRLRRKDDLEN